MKKQKVTKLRNRRCLPWRKLLRYAEQGVPQKIGITPLHRAAWKGDKQKVIKLLSSGVNPNVQDSDGYVPMYHYMMQ